MSTIFRDKVTLGRMVFNDYLHEVGLPYEVRCDGMDGWRNTASMDAVITPRGISDGAVLGPRFPAKEKYITVTGYYLAESRFDSDQAENEITLRIPPNEDHELIRWEPIPKRMIVRVLDAVEFDGDRIEEGFRFLLPLVAADPLKYGLQALSGESGISTPALFGRTYPRSYPLSYIGTGGGVEQFADLNLGGNTTTKAIITTLTGPLNKGSWRIINQVNGKTHVLSFDVGLTSGQTLVIDHKAHTALLNGYPVQIALSGEWWGLEPGLNRISLISGDFNAEARLNISAFPAWR